MAVLINGSYGKGAAIRQPSLSPGVGLLTNHIPGNLYNILQTSVGHGIFG
jgi:hypothetical protein